MTLRRAETDLRVVTLYDKDPDRFITPIQQPNSLPRAVVDLSRKSIEVAAREVLIENNLDLPAMSSVARLRPVGDVQGYLLQPAHGQHIDLRSFTVSAPYMDEILEHAETHPDAYDPADIEFIRQAFLRTYSDAQHISRRPRATTSRRRPVVTPPSLTEAL